MADIMQQSGETYYLALTLESFLFIIEVRGKERQIALTDGVEEAGRHMHYAKGMLKT